jgi:hypothetical protein
MHGLYLILACWLITGISSGCKTTQTGNIPRIHNETMSMGSDDLIENTQPLPESVQIEKQQNNSILKWPGRLIVKSKEMKTSNRFQPDLKAENQMIGHERRPNSIVPYVAFFLIIGILLVLMAAGITISTEAWAFIALGSVILLVLLFVFT